MTEYTEQVEKQRLKNAAEEWAKKPSQIHAFNTENTSVWYDNRRTDGRVIDTHYNNGTIIREISNTGKTVTMGKKIPKAKLLEKFLRWTASRRSV